SMAPLMPRRVPAPPLQSWRGYHDAVRPDGLTPHRRRHTYCGSCRPAEPGEPAIVAMAKLNIITAPDPRLKVKSRPVTRVDARIRRLMDDMLETMYAAPGIGLAAPQVGFPERVIVLDLAHEGDAPQPYRLANPELVWVSDEDATYNEGCLSLPEHYADVTRPNAIRVRYLDYEG